MPETPVAVSPRVSRTRLFIRALGTTFFSVLSVLIAFYAFTQLPQVQDLLFDARPYWIQEIIYWMGFYTIGIFIWALPLVFTARLLLLQNFDSIGIDTEERFKFYIFRLPGFFVVFAFGSLLFGVFAAADNIPVPLLDGGNKYEKYIDPLVESHLFILLIATVFVFALVLIRNLFIQGYGSWMERMERRDPEGFKNTLIRIERLTRKQQNKLVNYNNYDLHLTIFKPEFLSTETWIAAQRVKAFMWRYLSRLTIFLLVLVAIHFLSYSDWIGQLLNRLDLPLSPAFERVWSFLSDTLYLKRATFLFVVFGAWLPFVAILAALSNRFQFPIITILVAVGAGLTLFIGDGHDIRILKISSDQQKLLKPIEFAEAVKDWKLASGWNAKGCDAITANSPEAKSCPRPIIVAGEGGGSRAAFLLASVLGALEDDSRDVANHPHVRPFHNQLFAISSVSGSSVGASLFVSALKARPNYENVEQVKQSLYRQRLWFPNLATANLQRADASSVEVDQITKNFLGDFVSYKDSLQAVLSNDFISPTMIAYLARDVLMLSRFPFVYDRAGILETSWENAFNDVFGTSRITSPMSGPLQAMSPSNDAWMPLLFLNATSIETGRRIVVSPVKMAGTDGSGKELFIDAYDLHDLLCSPYVDPSTGEVPALSTLDQIARVLPSLFSPVSQAKCLDRKPLSIDVRLSTAAGISSRSPFVSPHAVIRDTRAQITDSAVDGGYFDNSGVVTAMEIAAALKQADPHLMPFILQVSSEPDWFKDTKICQLQATDTPRPQIPDQADFRPIGSISDLLTVNSTRVARSYETILQLPQQAAQLNNGASSVAQIVVCPQLKDNFFWSYISQFFDRDENERKRQRSMRVMKKAQQQRNYKSVSLSWWLSPPLQAFLDGQVYSKHNFAARSCVLSLLDEGAGAETKACP